MTHTFDLTRHGTGYNPFSPALGFGRTLIAIGTTVALMATPTEYLFYASTARPTGRVCENFAGNISLFCVVPNERLEAARWIAVATLIIVASGWRPRYTCLAHWYVSVSFYSSSNVFDGGDQVAAVITLLIIPICLCDKRRWHWGGPPEVVRSRRVALIAAQVSLYAVWLQASFIYFHASLSKLTGEEWKNGTAVWYWLSGVESSFSPPNYISGAVRAVLSSAIAVQAATWGTLAIEFGIACCLMARQKIRALALALGVSLHASIALLMGLPGFSCIMVGMLIMYLLRPGDPSVWPSRETTLRAKTLSPTRSTMTLKE
ncbi:sporulation-delaying protein SdpB family protein [Pseudonocardia sp. ICBG1142]|uniref:sporulation-delaying protein SdpB family protein n=1 Tax=Pseudonocardia sp. ICBG1142 TaxID=2846760 RepID=UPI001CF607AC